MEFEKIERNLVETSILKSHVIHGKSSKFLLPNDYLLGYKLLNIFVCTFLYEYTNT